MKYRAFKQVDVFAARRYAGNPLAVVFDSSDLDEASMQGFAQWTHLSETTFLFPPTEPRADYRVRIFTPGGELPFAGHPTLGSCHAWLEAGGQPKKDAVIVQQCQAGLVKIVKSGPLLAFAAPPLKRSAPSPATLARIAGALGLSARQIVAAQMLDNGPSWLGLLLDHVDTVLALQPDHRLLAEIGEKVGVAGIPEARTAATPLISRSNREARAFAPASPDDSGLEVRAFAAPIGVEEDPVTGSLNASLAQWLMAEGRLPERYVATQGRCLGRDGRVHVERDAEGQVWVGGESLTCIDGQVTL